MKIALIPARMGSQRLPKKNLRQLAGVPLITRAVRKCKQAGCFDAIWVNSEHPEFGDIARDEGVNFHLRPSELGDNQATSEQYIAEFLDKVPCEYVIQVHSIAPLLTVESVRNFVLDLEKNRWDCLLSVENIQLECVYQERPVNFNYKAKTNSQDLTPVQKISWSISGWRSSVFLQAVKAGRCATYAGKLGYHTVNNLAGLVIKTENDLLVAEALLPLVEGSV
jgi:CMP-N-acetylneuraminic acid synthetase